MAYIPIVIGKIVAVDCPSPGESLNGYYVHKITIRASGTAGIGASKSVIGQDIAVFVPRMKLGDEGEKPFSFAVGQRVSTIAFPIQGGYEAEGFRLIDETAEATS